MAHGLSLVLAKIKPTSKIAHFHEGSNRAQRRWNKPVREGKQYHHTKQTVAFLLSIMSKQVAKR